LQGLGRQRGVAHHSIQEIQTELKEEEGGSQESKGQLGNRHSGGDVGGKGGLSWNIPLSNLVFYPHTLAKQSRQGKPESGRGGRGKWEGGGFRRAQTRCEGNRHQRERRERSMDAYR
jgi:hypothetical protein